MITVNLNRTEFEYDIHSLLKAFFPKEDVEIYYTKEAHAEEKNVACTNHSAENETESASHLSITYEDKQISITCTLENQKPAECTFAVDFADRAETKNALKENLYHLLEEVTGQSLPWGTLTGIRPTKIPMQLLDEGKTKEEVASYMKKTYLASDEKVDLSIAIAERERALLSQLDYKNGYSLYIGIPFCPSTCLYCSFTSNPICAFEKEVGHYMECLKKELLYVKEAFKDKTLDTVYIGGGTPTTLSARQLDELIGFVEEHFDLSHLLEFTVEAGRADSITEEKLQVLHDHRIDRISVNPQTMKDETLKLIGRQHSVEQVKDAYALARRIGFANINMDIILGLPGEDETDVTNTIEEIKKLDPDSLTVHSLAIKRASKLRAWIEENGVDCLNNTDKTMEIAAAGAKAMGMNPYYLYRQKNMSGNFENVGYAKPGKYGVYNILIMEEVQTIVACGAGTVTKRVYGNGRIERCDNVKDVKLYMEKIDEMIERKQKLFAD